MSDLARIAEALTRLEEVQAELATIATRTDDARRQDLIHLRRKLALQIAAVGRVAEPIFDSAGDLELTRAYRAIFSQMRSAAARHQANWPAVRLGESVREYRASAMRVRKANQEFVAWVRDALGIP